MKVKFINGVFSTKYGIYKAGDIVEISEEFYINYKSDVEVLEEKEIKDTKDKMQRKKQTKEV